MTCIVGWIEDGTVWMGADSAGVAGYSMQIRKDEKVFNCTSYVMGFTSSFRMGQLLRYKLSIPACMPGTDMTKFMSTEFIDSVRTCLSDGGFREKKDEVESGGTFLVGVQGQLYEIGDDFQVGKVHEPFMACGCGQSYALGALAAMEKMKMHPRVRLFKALAIAEKYSAGVRRPFVLRRTPG